MRDTFLLLTLIGVGQLIGTPRAVAELVPSGVFHLYYSGDNVVVSPGPAGSNEPAVFQLTSNPSGPDYGGAAWIPNGPITANQITTLSADYQMTIGAFGGGAPRFSIADSGGNEAWIYWGTNHYAVSDPNAGSWGNTGNLADTTSSALYVASNGFGGLNSPNTYLTWNQFLADVGTTQVSEVFLDLDGGWSQPGQQMLMDNFTINNDVFDAVVTPEPSTFLLLGSGLLAAFAAKRKR